MDNPSRRAVTRIPGVPNRALGRFEICSIPHATTNLVKQIRYRWTDMYIFTGDRITGALYAQEDKEMDDSPCFSGSRLTFEERATKTRGGGFSPLDPGKNTPANYRG